MEKLHEALTLLLGCDLGSVEEGDVGDMAARYDAAQRCSEIAKGIAAACELALIDAMESDDVAVPSVGVLHRAVKPKRRVAPDGTRRFREDLVHLISTRVAVDESTGELNEEARRVALETSRAVLRAVNIYPGSISSKGRSYYHLDNDDYSETSWVTSVSILPEGEEP